ncbi:TPR repeat protein [Myxococcus hansupus]|uniref:TPR repeat protein n=1 Tax=Pseudomyxococcus hansupus TaxID=1297742 RepID=A0A0H4WT96_9BACT|nr:tetratricopeptide repeat protein [Myxococcus hansupus]AKQ64783.1 TPR repeat protein [Myxococcus hansupus]
MRHDNSKTPRFAGLTLPSAVRTALVPVSLVALGLIVAWADAPLPPALGTWLDSERQHARLAVVRVAFPAPEQPLTPGDGSAAGHTLAAWVRTNDVAQAEGRSAGTGIVVDASTSTPGNEDAPGLSRAAPDVDTSLALPHVHGRRVDHLSRAHLLREWDDLSGALTECRRAVHDAPEDTAAVSMVAELAGLTGRMDLAVRAYGQLGRLLPLDARPLVRQARLLVSMGRHPEAVAAGEEAVLRNPEYVEAYQVLGRAHLAQGELSAAMLRFQQAVHLNPEHGFALNNLGFTYLRAGENQKAAEALTQAAALLPHVAYVHNNLGVAFERLGQEDDARAAYAAAMHLSPRYVQARVNADRMRRMAQVDVGGAQTPRGQSRSTQGEGVTSP